MVHKPLGDINMSVQMIELEEVQMMEVSDDALEERATEKPGYSNNSHSSIWGNIC
jgi:hypothetical protein